MHFWDSFLKSLGPQQYRNLVYRDWQNGIKYVLILILLMLPVKLLFSLPTIVDVAGSVDQFHTKVTNADFKGVIHTNGTISVPSKRPLVQVDSSQDAERTGFVLLTDNEFIYKFGSTEKVVAYPDFSEPLTAGEITNLVLLVLFLLGPSLLLYAVLGSVVKFGLYALLLTSIATIFSSTLKFKITYIQTFSLALYSLTWAILLEAIFVPLRYGAYLAPLYKSLGFTIYLVPLTVTIIIFTLGFVLTGSKEFRYSG